MYKQENKTGTRAFFKVIGVTFLAILVSEFLGGLIGALSKDKINATLTGNIILAVLCVILVILIYNHYASVYTYKITKKHIVIEKRAGRKITEFDIPLEEIKKAYIKKSMPKEKGKKKGKTLRLCSSIFNNKNTSTIICGEENNIIIFEPDDKFIEKIKEYMND